MNKIPFATIILFSILALSFSGCVNKHGISLKYYSDCDEYYDMQGYYHKKCGKDDIFTYKEAGEKIEKTKTKIANNIKNIFVDEKITNEPQPNVW